MGLRAKAVPETEPSRGFKQKGEEGCGEQRLTWSDSCLHDVGGVG